MLTQLENELLDVNREIKKLEGIVNSPNVKWKYKESSKKLLPALAERRRVLTDQITEASLLHD